MLSTKDIWVYWQINNLKTDSITHNIDFIKMSCTRNLGYMKRRCSPHNLGELLPIVLCPLGKSNYKLNRTCYLKKVENNHTDSTRQGHGNKGDHLILDALHALCDLSRDILKLQKTESRMLRTSWASAICVFMSVWFHAIFKIQWHIVIKLAIIESYECLKFNLFWNFKKNPFQAKSILILTNHFFLISPPRKSKKII